MRSMRVPAFALGMVLVASAGGIAWQEMRTARDAASDQNTELRTAASNTETLLTEQFERAATVGLLLSRDAAYAQFFREPGTTQQKINKEIPVREDLIDRMNLIEAWIAVGNRQNLLIEFVLIHHLEHPDWPHRDQHPWKTRLVH